jgi:AmmeMemoRadiSam system protein B
MPLIGCFVTPHPPIIVPEVGGHELARVESTVKAMLALSDEMASLAPDTIVLLSPHAPLAKYQMAVSLARAYRGSFDHFMAPQVVLQEEGDVEVGTAILEEASRHGIPATATGSNEAAYELDHGTMVPLYYLTSKLSTPAKLVLLSFSYLDVDEHVRFGRAIGDALRSSPKRIAYVASSDLSHRLTPQAPAGFDPRGAEFDHAVVDLFSKNDWEGLLSLNGGLVAAAGECGYRSLAVLSGIVEALSESGSRAQNRLLSYEGPFGVGYMVGRVDLSPAELVEAQG